MTQPDSMPTAPARDLADAVRFQRDLYLYWRTVAAMGGLPLSSRRAVGRPALRRLRTALAEGPDAGSSAHADAEQSEREDTRLLYLRRLLERLGLLRAAPDEGKLVAADAALMGRYLAHPLAERLRICARLWAHGGWWPDNPGAHVSLPPLGTPAPPPVARARQRLLDGISVLRPGETLTPPGPPITKAVVQRRVTARGRKRPPVKAASPTLDAAETTLRAALLGPLAWMGLVVVEDAACRITDALVALRIEGDAGLEETAGRVVVQSNLSVLTLPPLTAPTLYTLDTCAEETALGLVAHYQLTREALAQARKAGWEAAEVIARLEALAGAALPANVRTTLLDWERHIERIRLTPDVSVLEVHDAALLDALLAESAARVWVARRLSPTAALLRKDAVVAVRAWLLAHGELPATITGEDASDRKPSER